VNAPTRTLTSYSEVLMSQLTTAGRLLADLYREGQTVLDTVLNTAGVSIERADAAMGGSLRLTLSEQLRISEAASIIAPKYARDATRLRAQVLAAKSYESGELVERRRDGPPDRREHSNEFRG
jgi:hypothetical protein